LPRYTQGETFNPTKIEMNEGQTSPPNLLTEADLIALMEKHGIGNKTTEMANPFNQYSAELNNIFVI